MLECAGAFSPRVEDRERRQAFLCVIDIAGTEMLFGPPATLAKNLLDRVKALGIVASVAISSNFHTAICLARGRLHALTAVIAPVRNALSGASATCGSRSFGGTCGDIFSLGHSHSRNVGGICPRKN